MTALNSNPPRRYFVDSDGRRVLIGLTVEETCEFEKLDLLPALQENGAHILWEAGGRPVSKQAERWLELYSKHDQAWIKWMADTRAERRENLPFLN
jgi:hypothetical protein